MEWLKLEDVKSIKGAIVKARGNLLALAREDGAEVDDDAKIAVGLGDNQTVYAIEDFDDFVFWCDGLFVPDNRDDLLAEIDACLK